MGNAALRRALHAKALCAVIVKFTNHEVEERLKRDGIQVSPGALVLLRFLKSERLTMKELSARLLLSPPTLVPIIGSLEKKGIVRRERDIVDHRKIHIALTKKGTALISNVPLISQDNRLVKGIGGLGPKKAGQLIALLEELAQSTTGRGSVCAKVREIVSRETGKRD